MAHTVKIATGIDQCRLVLLNAWTILKLLRTEMGIALIRARLFSLNGHA